MPPAGQFREHLILIAVASALFVLGSSISAVSTALLVHVLTILTVWTALSVPLAILIGHCALSEE